MRKVRQDGTHVVRVYSASKVSESYKDHLYEDLSFTMFYYYDLRLYPRWKWNSTLLDLVTTFINRNWKKHWQRATASKVLSLIDSLY